MRQLGLWEVLMSLVPVIAFLISLNALDTYRLLTLRSIVSAIAAGCAAAAISYPLNSWGFTQWGSGYAFVGGPALEECAKAAYVFICIARHRVGFPVDASVTGFAVGSGFSLIENLVYLYQMPPTSMLVWLVRGVGTATMHGGATAIVAIAAVAMFPRLRWFALLPALALGILIHGLYNGGVLPPLERSAVILITLPALLMAVFRQSERMLARWLHNKMDDDLETLNKIESGVFLDSPAGIYLTSLRDLFKAEIVADMFCFLRLSAELSAKAKSELMQLELGFTPEPDPERAEIVKEIRHLERSIGVAGRSALAPLVPASAQDRWERFRMK